MYSWALLRKKEGTGEATFDLPLGCLLVICWYLLAISSWVNRTKANCRNLRIVSYPILLAMASFPIIKLVCRGTNSLFVSHFLSFGDKALYTWVTPLFQIFTAALSEGRHAGHKQHSIWTPDFPLLVLRWWWPFTLLVLNMIQPRPSTYHLKLLSEAMPQGTSVWCQP